MDIFVTGGADFIGFNLVKRSLRSGHSVTVLDNLSHGKTENLAGVETKCNMLIGDVTKPEVVKHAMKNVDTVIHLAALVDVRESLSNPDLYHEVNAKGTLILLYLARRNARKFIYASTCAVYGNSD